MAPDEDGDRQEAIEQSNAPTPTPANQQDDAGSDGGAFAGSAARPWRAELARWLLTLNPGRTQDEYTKAVGYFFAAPGAPQSLDRISADLLLAYRGALAMRAERANTARGARGPGTATTTRLERLWGEAPGARRLPGEQEASAEPTRQAPPLSHLAPATVNLRLTALRQFLRFATMREPLSGLSVERIQHALRRLPIERRRPYQILSEEEWPAFLAVARAPLPNSTAAPSRAVGAEASGGYAPPSTPPLWGHTRAERARASQTTQTSVEQGDGDKAGVAIPATQAPRAPHRAHDGRTGARTAERDYILVALALTTGLRAIELSLLDVSDLTRERRDGQIEWWLTLPDEKTKGQRGGRTLPLAPDVVTILLSYLEFTGRSYRSAHDRDTPLFLALPNGPHAPAASGADPAGTSRRERETHRLSPEQIRAVINRIEIQWLELQEELSGGQDAGAGERRISPHALRHSAAIALLKGSDATGRPPASVEHVRGWLGHFDIRTTQRYLDHLSSRDERRRFTIAADLRPKQASASSEADTSPSAPEEDEPM